MKSYRTMAQNLKTAVEDAGYKSVKHLSKALAQGILPVETAASALESLSKNKGYVFPDISGVRSVGELTSEEAAFIGRKAFPALVEHDFELERLLKDLKDGKDVNRLFEMLDEALEMAPEGADFSPYLYNGLPGGLYSLIGDPYFKPEYLSRPDWVNDRYRTGSGWRHSRKADLSVFDDFKKISAAGATLADIDHAAGGHLDGKDIRVLAEYADKIGPELLASVRATHENAPLEKVAKDYLVLSGAGHDDAMAIIERLGILEKDSFGPKCQKVIEEALASEDPQAALFKANPALIKDDATYELRLEIIAEDGKMEKYLDHCGDRDSLEAMRDVMRLDTPDGIKRANLEYLSKETLSGSDRKALADLLVSRPEKELSTLNYPAGIYGEYDAPSVAKTCLQEPGIGKILSETGKKAENYPLYGIAAVAKSDLSPEDKVRIVRDLHMAETEDYEAYRKIAHFIEDILLKYEDPVNTPVFAYLVESYPDADPEVAKYIPDILEDWRFEKTPVFTPVNTAVAKELRYGVNHLPDGSVADEFFTGKLNKTQIEELYRIRILLGQKNENEPEWGNFSGSELRKIRQALSHMNEEQTAKALASLSPGMERKEIETALAV